MSGTVTADGKQALDGSGWQPVPVLLQKQRGSFLVLFRRYGAGQWNGKRILGRPDTSGRQSRTERERPAIILNNAIERLKEPAQDRRQFESRGKPHSKREELEREQPGKYVVIFISGTQ